jgi:cytochrome c-type biogenesis protein CcmH
MRLEQGQNPETLVLLGVTVMESQGGQMTERSDTLFENALALAPNNPNALFYGGTAAERRGDLLLAADRWESVLSANPPPEIRELISQKISQWRGHPPITTAPGSAPESAPVVEGEVIATINVRLSEEAQADLPADATVYVIARDPGQPSPPIAVIPQRLSLLPAVVEFRDINAMIAGRPLSGFSEFEVVARVSLSGAPTARSGDWSGALIVTANSGQTVDLVIDQKIP